MRPANTVALDTGCPQNLYLLAIRHRHIDLVIALIMYLLISIGYCDLHMRNQVVIFARLCLPQILKNKADNKYIKTQWYYVYSHAHLRLSSFPTIGWRKTLIYIIRAMPDKFQYLPYMSYLLPSSFIFLAWSF